MTTEVKSITPEWASEVLSKQELFGFKNRKVLKSVVEGYADQMTRGLWRLNGEPLIFDGNRCLNGEHRLRAVVRAGVPVQMLVVRGVSEDAFATIDTGRKRLAADVLSIDGHGTNARIKAGASRLAITYLRYGSMYTRGGSDGKIHPPEILSFVNEYREEIERAIEVSAPAADFAGMPSLFTAIALLVRDHPWCAGFFKNIGDGLALMENDAVYHLRDRFTVKASRVSRAKDVAKAAWIIKAWNSYSVNRPMALLRWNSEKEDFPVISGCDREKELARYIRATKADQGRPLK